jgi:hypothetical protein
MNCTELFNEVKSWLEAEKILFVSDDEVMFRFRISADNGLFDIRVLCEEEPAVLQVCCPLTVRVPKEKVCEAGLILHNINTRLRMGSFQFHVEERVVEFRLTMPIRMDGELADQFSQTVGTTVTAMDEHLRSLGLLACATPEAQKALESFKPSPENQSAEPSPPSRSRFELN